MSRVPISSVVALALAAAVSPQRASAAGLALSGHAAATSDYVFRGVSQTRGEPALQLGAKLAHGSGLYASIWGSNVDYGRAVGGDAEVDYAIGAARARDEGWGYDVNLTRYTYPGTREAHALDYAELIATLTFRADTWLTVGWSDDAFASGEPGTWVQIGRKLPLGERFRLEVAAARYALDDAAYARDYAHAQLSAAYLWRRVELRATVHRTSGATAELFGDAGDSRLEVAAAVTF